MDEGDIEDVDVLAEEKKDEGGHHEQEQRAVAFHGEHAGKRKSTSQWKNPRSQFGTAIELSSAVSITKNEPCTDHSGLSQKRGSVHLLCNLKMHRAMRKMHWKILETFCNKKVPLPEVSR